MSRNVRFKLSEEEYRVVLEATKGLGVSVDVLAKQALAYTLGQARKLASSAETIDAASEDTTGTVSERDHKNAGTIPEK